MFKGSITQHREGKLFVFALSLITRVWLKKSKERKYLVWIHRI